MNLQIPATFKNNTVAASAATNTATIQSHRFAHGLTLVHHYMPGTGVTAIDVWVKAGSVFEPDAWSGMAHFLEHMIFKGTDRLTPGQFDREIEGHGGFANAATSQDYAHYFMVMATQHLSKTLPYLAELLLNAAIPEDEFDAERQVVFEELRQAWDNPDYVGFEELNQLIYQHHSYRRPILGTIETLKSLTPETMRQFHRSRYRPENMTVVLVGDVDFEQAIAWVGQAFDDFPTPSSITPPNPEAEPPLTGIRRHSLTMPTIEQSRLMLAWLTTGWDAPTSNSLTSNSLTSNSLRTGYILDLISVLLTGGRSARLVQELVEQRSLAYGVDASFSLQRDSGLFMLTAWLEAEHIDRVEAIFADRLDQLANQAITPSEMNRVKRCLCNEQAYSTETPDQIAGLYGYYATIQRLEMATKYAEQIRSITSAEIQQVAQQFLSPHRYGSVVMKS